MTILKRINQKAKNKNINDFILTGKIWEKNQSKVKVYG